MPGESQITAEALKALSPEALATIANAVIAYIGKMKQMLCKYAKLS
jgi:hypothetical protein